MPYCALCRQSMLFFLSHGSFLITFVGCGYLEPIAASKYCKPARLFCEQGLWGCCFFVLCLWLPPCLYYSEWAFLLTEYRVPKRECAMELYLSTCVGLKDYSLHSSGVQNSKRKQNYPHRKESVGLLTWFPSLEILRSCCCCFLAP